MTITWGTLRGYIREAILKDVPDLENSTSTQFSDDQLLIAARWACMALSQHTAQQAVAEIEGDGVESTFELPTDIVGSIEKTALVVYSYSNVLEYLAPIRLIPGTYWPTAAPADDASQIRGYWQWPETTLNLSFIPANNSIIEVRYFKTWDAPEDEDSDLVFPQIFEQPFAYFVGAQTFDPLGAQASAIRQWNRKSDSGNPEDNSLHRQSEFFLKLAQKYLDAIGAQDRETFYRESPRDFGFVR